MARTFTFPPDTRPTSRPSASGADREVASPVAGLAALGAAGVALSAAAAWIAATGAGTEPRGFSAAAHALVIAAPMAAGLYAVYRNPGGRFGWLLVLAAVLWSPTMLAESSDSVLYSIGRVWVWSAELLLIYLVLAFPSGRLVSRADRLFVDAVDSAGRKPDEIAVPPGLGIVAVSCRPDLVGVDLQQRALEGFRDVA